jgi:hypothetical protein
LNVYFAWQDILWCLEADVGSHHAGQPLKVFSTPEVGGVRRKTARIEGAADPIPICRRRQLTFDFTFDLLYIFCRFTGVSSNWQDNGL